MMHGVKKWVSIMPDHDLYTQERRGSCLGCTGGKEASTSAEDLRGWPRRNRRGACFGPAATALSSSSTSSRKRLSTSCPSSTCTCEI